ncbi:MAG: DUF4270 family protein [Cytophagales bacterium]
MNWWQNSTFLRVLIGILAMAMVACKTGNEISGEVNPSEKLGAFFQDNFKLQTTVVQYDSARTNASFRLLVGKHTDPVFGTVAANAFVQFTNAQNTTNFGPNAVADSIYVLFTIGESTVSNSVRIIQSPYFYGSPSNKITFKVYKLTSSINVDTTYYTRNNSVGYDLSNLLGTVSLNNDSITDVIDALKIRYNLQKNAIDTISRSVKIYLPTYLAEQFVKDQSKFATEAEFKDYFKGLALISDPSNASIIGIYDVQVVLRYHNYFGLNNLYSEGAALLFASFKFDARNAQNQFTVDRSTGNLQTLGQTDYDSKPTADLGNRCYTQSNTGIFTKVVFGDLAAFQDSVKNTSKKTKVLVNRAELVIVPDTSDVSTYFLPSQLYAFEMTQSGKVQRDVNGNFQYLQSELNGIFGSASPLYSNFDSFNFQYRFTITAYVQALLDGTKANNGLLIGSANTLTTGLFLGSLNRLTFLNGATNTASKSKIQLKIYYTPY